LALAAELDPLRGVRRRSVAADDVGVAVVDLLVGGP